MTVSAERTAQRGLRYTLLAVFVVGVRRRDPGAVVNAVVAAIGTCLPDLVERAYDIELRPWQRLYVRLGMVTHAVGMLGPYDDVWWWDHLTHTHSSSILAGAVFALSRHRGRDPGPRVVAVVACLGLLWELLEYAVHSAGTRLGFEPVLVSYGPKDTALDLVFDLVGALLVLAFGDRVLGDLAADS
ncbi:hypothetical protein [Natrinema altunense]|uniref:DUF2238 domain-containing protein n=2 Tax=Natrinema altunense TaxID=222984 RepID=M0A3Y3_NATA2|nr:hypothetical protein [Natrinema altunense]ELY92043.1 hypothetical protein C485_00830 [Natrinema altunense JCM 12890]RZH67883.1 hypothetical protein ELS17_10185 [Natrinema altunense]